MLTLSGVAVAAPDSFVLQGALRDADGRPLSGDRDYRVRFYGAATGGPQLGLAATGSVGLSSTGRFTITLPWQEEWIASADLWYELAVDSNRTPDGLDAGDVFPGRQRLQGVFHAQRAADADTLGGEDAATFARAEDLADYATTESLADYATTESLADYATVESLSDYVQRPELDAYATVTSLQNYATIASLSGYATVESLGAYATIASLANYATVTSLSNFATLEALQGYVPLATLNNYATLVQLAQKADVAHTHDAGDITTGIIGYPRLPSDIVRQADLEGIAVDVSLQDAYDEGRTVNTGAGAVRLNGAGGLEVEGNVATAGEYRIANTIGGTQLGVLRKDADGAKLELNDENGSLAVRIGPAMGASGGVGSFRRSNPAHTGIGLIGHEPTDNAPIIALFNAAQGFAIYQSHNTPGGGYIEASNRNGTPAVQIAEASDTSGGIILVSNSAGTAVAGILGGDIIGQTKNFVVRDPSRADRMIRYTSLEGPEAAIYARGTVTLERGRAIVPLPEHFASLAVPESITVSLTPRSLDSRGLAAVDITAQSFTVGELYQGTGEYAVDYAVYAVRRGYEDYPVYVTEEEIFGKIERPTMDAPTARGILLGEDAQ